MENPPRTRPDLSRLRSPFRHSTGADEGGGDSHDHERGGVDGHRDACTERPRQQPGDSGGADEGEDIQGLLGRDGLGQVVLADHSWDEGRPGGPGHRRSAAEHGDQEHDRRDRVKEDERDRGRHLDQATPEEEAPGVVGVDQASDRAGEQ